MKDSDRHDAEVDRRSLRFALMVTSAPGQNQGAMSAYRFARAITAEGHKLAAVFFFEDGVFNGSTLFRLPADRFDLIEAWRSLAFASGAELMLCSTSAEQRGIFAAKRAAWSDEYPSNVAPGFSISGLAAFMERLDQIDRILVFGG